MTPLQRFSNAAKFLGTLPRAKKQSTGLFLTLPSVGPLFRVPPSIPEKKTGRKANVIKLKEKVSYVTAMWHRGLFSYEKMKKALANFKNKLNT